MIALLRGRLFEKHPTRVIVETGGVGYEVHVPLSSFASIGDVGSDVTLRVHTHVREDALQLFGFTTALEQTLFERLVSVSGIGPRLALAVLSGSAPQDLVRAVSAGDAARLVAIPGIGRKTADRIVLELRDKMASIEQAGEGAASGDGLRADLVSALVNLGYHRPAAEKAVETALSASGGEFDAALRQALDSDARCDDDPRPRPSPSWSMSDRIVAQRASTRSHEAGPAPHARRHIGQHRPERTCRRDAARNRGEAPTTRCYGRPGSAR
jgi:Holliday junction DNA helicase RuvA